jgi:DNA-binding beta-propeller fold protein YncE
MFGLSGAITPLAAQGTPGLSVTVSIAPVPSIPDEVYCKSEISDLATGKLIAAPNVRVMKGENGKVSIGDTATDSLVFEISVAKSGASATYSVCYTKNGKVVSAQKATITIH